MNFRRVVLITCLITTSFLAKAQDLNIGVKGGTNLTKIDGRSFDQGFKWGFSAGGFAEINFTQHLGIQPEVLFNQSNTKTANDFNQVYDQGINSRNVSLNYLSIPVLLAIKPSPMLSILIGPQFGILINQDQNILANGKSAFKTGDFSAVGGAQLNLGGFKLGARYIIGLNNLDDIGNQDKWKNQNIQLYIGFRII